MNITGMNAMEVVGDNNITTIRTAKDVQLSGMMGVKGQVRTYSKTKLLVFKCARLQRRLLLSKVNRDKITHCTFTVL